MAVQACARCCLRFSGESSDIYAAPAPEFEDLKAALPATDDNARASEPPITGRPGGSMHKPGELEQQLFSCTEQCALPRCSSPEKCCWWKQRDGQIMLTRRQRRVQCAWACCSVWTVVPFPHLAATSPRQCSMQAAVLSRGFQLQLPQSLQSLKPSSERLVSGFQISRLLGVSWGHM